MSDFYFILGISKNANDAEIKSAFRKLAKIYHPDKNPNNPDAKIIFEKILKSYATLSNPLLKKKYDYTLFYQAASVANSKSGYTKNKKTKEYSATEDDLKQRQFYQNYYKTKQKEEAVAEPEKAKYNDFKYVLFATPIAIALVMFIISFFTTAPNTRIKKEMDKQPVISDTIKQLNNGDKPYSGFFGPLQTEQTTYSFQINNTTNYDAVIVLCNKKTGAYIQHAYLQEAYFVTFTMLPEDGVYWKCMLGKNWNKDKMMFNNKIIGCFDSIVQFQNWNKKPIIFKNNNTEHLTLLSVIKDNSAQKSYISNDIHFFEK